MTKTPATLAKQMERTMQRSGKDCLCYQNEHCTLFENDLEHICPIKDKDRKKKLAEFAAQYGFRLRFYHQGLFAIFGKRTLPVANDVRALWPSVACSASSAKVTSRENSRDPEKRDLIRESNELSSVLLTRNGGGSESVF